jgi:hypothetical protein
VAVFSQTFFALVRGDLMPFAFFATGQVAFTSFAGLNFMFY